MDMEDTPTLDSVIESGNELARQFYAAQGCQVDYGYKFYDATHPQEIGCWNLAVIAYEHIEGTPLDECLEEWREEHDK